MRGVFTKHYDGKPVLDSLVLDIAPGMIVRITGPSGRGKTTLMRLVAGLEENEADMPNDFSSLRCSFVFQEDRLCPTMSAISNITIASGVSKKEAASALAELGITEPKKKASELSGGTRRRVAIARAMLAESDMVLLDEPFTGLDPETKAKAAAFVLSRRRGRSLLVSTHDDEDADLLGADRAVPV